MTGQFGLVKPALHHDRAIGHEDRHSGAIPALEVGFPVDIDDFHGPGPGLRDQHVLRRLAKMAASTRVK